MTTPRVQQRQHGRQQGTARGNNNKHRPRQLPVQQERKTRPFCTLANAKNHLATCFQKQKDNGTVPGTLAGARSGTGRPPPMSTAVTVVATTTTTTTTAKPAVIATTDGAQLALRYHQLESTLLLMW